MAPARPDICIVGGGLAGLTLGIGLRQCAVPVRIVEAGRYPRHRVCGEFIRGRGQETLRRLGLWDSLQAVGARPARTGAFYVGDQVVVRTLPEEALCVERFHLDSLLARTFSDSGGELVTDSRWVRNDWPSGFVRSTGRRVQVDRRNGSWFGLKCHLRGIALKADLELHFMPGGYVGLCRLAGGKVNACGLFHTRLRQGSGRVVGKDWFLGQVASSLCERMAAAEWLDDSFCAVAGIPVRPARARGDRECSIGDAVSMIAPLTGNGMSMAFESGELATEPLNLFHQGAASWESTSAEIARRINGAFSTRLRLGWWLHYMIFQLGGARFALAALKRDAAWRLFFALTR